MRYTKVIIGRIGRRDNAQTSWYQLCFRGFPTIDAAELMQPFILINSSSWRDLKPTKQTHISR